MTENYDASSAQRLAGFAVVDVETTGFYNIDRIVEVGIILLNRQGQVVDEYDTLVNPERDVGATEVHGISASMVELAPIFSEIASPLADRLRGQILVAHNLTFDQRMLALEYSRLGSTMDSRAGICTLQLTGERLGLACEHLGVPVSGHHRALADARAAAGLLVQFLDEIDWGEPQTFSALPPIADFRTLRRETIDSQQSSKLRRLVARTPFPTSDSATLCYLDALDWVLDDRIIDKCEEGLLSALATDLGLSSAQLCSANRRYVQAMVAAAVRDGVVTENERSLMSVIAQALGVDDVAFPAETEAPKVTLPLKPGLRVCFTGSVTTPGGVPIAREELEAKAAIAGLQPVPRVTKKACNLLVAADPSSASGKAKKARAYGIPIMAAEQFIELIR